MSVSENELRDILKIVRQLERVLEQALRTETEKNEERLKRQLESSGISVEEDLDAWIEEATDSSDAFEL